MCAQQRPSREEATVKQEGAIFGLRDHLRALDEEQKDGNSDWPSCAVYFENSSACNRSPFYSCQSSRCSLVQFVPYEFRGEATPCRHIQLNEQGETLHSLSIMADAAQMKIAVRNWLISTITMLDSDQKIFVAKAA
jgi:hypothetical protein